MTAPAPDSSQAFAHAHDALLRQGGIQFSFPAYVAPVVPGWVKAIGRFLHDHATALGWAFWIAAGLVAAFVLYQLIRAYWPALSKWRPKRAEPKVAPADAWRPTVAQARQLLAESDALAAGGRYAEAVHLILLRSIEDIQERRAGLVRAAFTSREIGSLRALPGPARAAFGGIARLVERARFAQHPIGADDFAQARADYEAFALAPSWRDAA
jgi:hypothetical protein